MSFVIDCFLFLLTKLISCVQLYFQYHSYLWIFVQPFFYLLVLRIDAFCLQYAIDTFCNGIVRRLVVLCHGDCNAVAFQHAHICVTAILDTTVGVMDEACEALSSTHLYRLVYGHLQNLLADGCLQGVRHCPSDHLVGVGVSYQRRVQHRPNTQAPGVSDEEHVQRRACGAYRRQGRGR